MQWTLRPAVFKLRPCAFTIRFWKVGRCMSHVLKHALGQLLIVAFCVAAVSAARPATSGFQKLQSSAGRWEGKDDEGKAVKTEFKLVAGGSAVLETLAASGMEDMLSGYRMNRESH